VSCGDTTSILQMRTLSPFFTANYDTVDDFFENIDVSKSKT